MALALVAVRLAAASPRARATVGRVLALLLAAYMVTTIQFEHYWHDYVTFFEQRVAVDLVHLDYGLKLVSAMDGAGDYKGAVRVLQRWTAIDADNAPLQLILAQQYQRMGRELDSEREFRKFNELSNSMLQQQRAEKVPRHRNPQESLERAAPRAAIDLQQSQIYGHRKSEKLKTG